MIWGTSTKHRQEIDAMPNDITSRRADSLMTHGFVLTCSSLAFSGLKSTRERARPDEAPLVTLARCPRCIVPPAGDINSMMTKQL